MPVGAPVTLPFLAKLTDIETTNRAGGALSFTYSNFMRKVRFVGLSSFALHLKKGRIYSKGALLGTGGYVKRGDGRAGVIYYLLNKDGSVYSPFLFHHVYRIRLADAYASNFDIAVRYYRMLYRRGSSFEKYFFISSR